MMGYDVTDEQEPLGYLGGYPIHAATLLLIVHSAALLAATLLMAFGATGVLNALVFSSEAVLGRGWVWQFVTYPFVHVPGSPLYLLLFAAEMYFGLFIFGREVERYLGRGTFCLIYAALVVITPLVLTVAGFVTKTNQQFVDSWIVHLGVFVAYATIYPNASVFWTVPSKWMVALILGGFGLFCLASHNWSLLLVSWSSAFVAYVITRSAGVGDDLPIFANLRQRFRSQPENPRPGRARTIAREELDADDVLTSVDSVLEKISRQGMSSLTSGERATLERARASLLKRKDREA